MLSLPGIDTLRPGSTPVSTKRSLFSSQSKRPVVPAVEEADRDGGLKNKAVEKNVFALKESADDLSPPERGHSQWQERSEYVKCRPRGWLQRFAANIDESNIFIPPPTPWEQRSERIAASGWKNTPVSKSEMDFPAAAREESAVMSDFPDLAPRTCQCSHCGLHVPTGSELVRCIHCSLVTHLNCIPDVEDHLYLPPSRPSTSDKARGSTQPTSSTDVAMLKKGKKITFAVDDLRKDAMDKPRSAGKKKPPPRASSASPATPTASASSPRALMLKRHADLVELAKGSKPRVAMSSIGTSIAITSSGLVATDLRWECKFCLSELQVYIDHARDRVALVKQGKILLRACVKVQSFCRMVAFRLRYLKLLRGLRMFQSVIRMRKLVAQGELDRANERYTYRLCVHEIKMIIANPHRPDTGSATMPTPTASTSTSIGIPSTPSGTPAAGATHARGPHRSSHVEFPILRKPHIVGELNSVTFDKLFGAGRPANPPVDTKDQEIVELLAEGVAELSGGYAKSYRGIQLLSKGTMFLTVSVMEHQQDLAGDSMNYFRRPVRLARFDLLLKEDAKVQPIKPSTLHKFGFRDLPGDVVASVCKHYAIATFRAPKPCVLIPYSRANAEVRMTVSQVTDWPKALVVGQTSHNIKFYVARHRVTTLYQSLADCTFADLPTQEEGGKLNLFMPRPGSASSPSGGRSPSRLLRETAASRNGSRLPPPDAGEGRLDREKRQAQRTFYSGIVPWSLMTMGYSEFNEAGFIMTLNQEAVSSTKKKCWCILLDRILYVYNVVRDTIQPKYAFDVRSSYVQLLPNEVFKVKFNTETLYFLSLNKRDHENWFRKIYSQSQSHHVVPYQIYVKRRLPARSNSQLPRVLTEIRKGVASTMGFDVSDKQRSPSSKALHASTPHHRRRSSMEEVELMSLEVDFFLEDMRHKYLEFHAEKLPSPADAKKRAKAPLAQLQSPNGTPTKSPKASVPAPQVESSVTISSSSFFSSAQDPSAEFSSFVGRHRESVLGKDSFLMLTAGGSSSRDPASSSSRPTLVRQRTISGLLGEKAASTAGSGATPLLPENNAFAERMAKRSTAVSRKGSHQARELLEALTSTIVQARSIF